MWWWIIKLVEEGKVRFDSVLCALRRKTSFIIWAFHSQDKMLFFLFFITYIYSAVIEVKHRVLVNWIITHNCQLVPKRDEHKCKHKNHSVLLCKLFMDLNHCVPVTMPSVQHKEKDGDDDSSQHSQTNCEAHRRHICRHREMFTDYTGLILTFLKG